MYLSPCEEGLNVALGEAVGVLYMILLVTFRGLPFGDGELV